MLSCLFVLQRAYFLWWSFIWHKPMKLFHNRLVNWRTPLNTQIALEFTFTAISTNSKPHFQQVSLARGRCQRQAKQARKVVGIFMHSRAALARFITIRISPTQMLIQNRLIVRCRKVTGAFFESAAVQKNTPAASDPNLTRTCTPPPEVFSFRTFKEMQEADAPRSSDVCTFLKDNAAAGAQDIHTMLKLYTIRCRQCTFFFVIIRGCKSLFGNYFRLGKCKSTIICMMRVLMLMNSQFYDFWMQEVNLISTHTWWKWNSLISFNGL